MGPARRTRPAVADLAEVVLPLADRDLELRPRRPISIDAAGTFPLGRDAAFSPLTAAGRSDDHPVRPMSPSARRDRRRSSASSRADCGTPDHSSGGDRSGPVAGILLGDHPAVRECRARNVIVSRLGSSTGSGSPCQQPGAASRPRQPRPPPTPPSPRPPLARCRVAMIDHHRLEDPDSGRIARRMSLEHLLSSEACVYPNGTWSLRFGETARAESTFSGLVMSTASRVSGQ